MHRLRLIYVCSVFLLATAVWTADVAATAPGTVSAPTVSTPTRSSLSTTGTLLPAGNDLPTATGERLSQTFAVEVPERISGGAVLIDGDILVGNAISLQAGNALIATGSFGSLQVPAPQLAAVLVTSAPASLPVRAPAMFTGAILISGERVVGQPTFLNQTHAGIDNGKRVVQVPRERVSALVIHPLSTISKPVVRLRLATGDLVSGIVTAGSDGAYSLKHPLGTWTIPRHQVGSWWTESAERTALSMLIPTATYREDLDPPLVPMSVDQDTDGASLHLGRLRVDRGMMMRVGTTATFTLDGSWKSLVAMVGMAHGGPAAVFVTGDQKPLWDSGPLSSGTAAVPFTVPVQGVKLLTVTIVAQPESTIPGYAVVAWPFLLK